LAKIIFWPIFMKFKFWPFFFLTVDSYHTNIARVMKFGTKVNLMDSSKLFFQIFEFSIFCWVMPLFEFFLIYSLLTWQGDCRSIFDGRMFIFGTLHNLEVVIGLRIFFGQTNFWPILMKFKFWPYWFLTVNSDHANNARVMKFGTKVHLMNTPRRFFQIFEFSIFLLSYAPFLVFFKYVLY